MTAHGDGPGVFCITLAFDVDANSEPDAKLIAKDCCDLLNAMWEGHGAVPCTVAAIERLNDDYSHLLPIKDRP